MELAKADRLGHQLEYVSANESLYGWIGKIPMP